MIEFCLGLIIGIFLGAIVMAFVKVGDRYDD